MEINYQELQEENSTWSQKYVGLAQENTKKLHDSRKSHLDFVTKRKGGSIIMRPKNPTLNHPNTQEVGSSHLKNIVITICSCGLRADLQCVALGR